MKKKSMLLALIFVLSFLASAAFAEATYVYTTNWFYNGAPVNGVRGINYVCNDLSCNTFGAKTFDQTSATNSITIPYATPATANGYGTYWAAPCYVYYEMWWAPMSGGSSPQNMQFTKKSGCSAPILSIQLPPTFNIGTAAPISIRVNSALQEISATPNNEPNDTSFVQNFLSASTSVRIEVRNSTNDVVYTNIVTDYILQDTASTIVFTWTPTQAGTYSISAVTNVPDCKCSSSLQQMQTINNVNVMSSGSNLPPIVNVLSPSPAQQFALCENINFNVNATDPDGTVQNIVWSINGQIYAGNNFPVAATVFGVGQIPGTVTVTDNSGGITSVNFNFSVLSHPNPLVIITQPVFNPAPTTIYNYGLGAMIIFNALATPTDICNPPSGFQYIWRDNGVNIMSNQQSFSLDNLTLGLHNMTVYVTDGLGGVAADNMIINITQTPNVCPAVQITSPLNGNTFANPCQQIDFASSVIDSDGTINSVSWIYSSSIISTNYNFTSNASYFGVGNRVVTLSAVDNSGCQRNASVNFDVLAHLNPVCLITLPINNPNPAVYYAYPMNVPIPFSAMATAQDACAPPSYSWIWRDNNIPIVTNSNNFTVSNLSLGPHNMTVYASDGYGGQCYDTILVNITDTNTPPVANIITPVNNQQFVQECEMISFTSQVYDTNIGGSIQSIQWIWNGNILSTQENFTINASTFNLGNNTVTLTAVDNDGIPTIDSVTFNIASHSQPAVMITSPPNGSLYTQGTMINFNAQAFPTDVCVPIFNWIWRDNNIPWVSGQQSFSLNNLTAGLHDITAYAYDQYGQSNYSRVFINITTIPNIAPIIAGIRCVNNSGGPLIKEWDPIICNATAYDTNGMITSWLWSINGSGVSIGPNASNDIFTLPGGLNDGNYTVRLTVLDNGTPVLSATSSIPLMILPNIPPVVMINSPAVDPYWNMEFCPINFNASASDADGYILQPWDEIYTWNVAMANGTSQFISTSQGFSYVNRLPAGFNTFTVSVTDDDGATASDSVAINTTKNIPPTVQILLPVSVPTYNISEGNNITFDASVTAGNSDDCSGCTLNDYAWAWFDTYNGVTTQISSQKGFTLLNPGIGIHTITVSSTDCYMASNIDAITVNVTEVPNQNPVVTIWRPLATGVDYYIDHCENVQFNATAIDPDGDSINAWMWNFETLAGMQMRTVPLFTVPAINFSIGNHTAYAYAFDNQTPPGVGSASVNYEIREHTNPIASIIAPANGTQWLVGLPLTFIGNAVSTDRCNANTFSWIWTEDGNIMSTQPNFSISTLSLGWHKVTLFATDQYGHSNSTSRYINITQNVNVPPVITTLNCYDMTGNSTIMEFENFFCNATATDFDGIITTWIWDIEGDGVGPQFGTSTFMAPVTLINGTYNVTLIVVDNGTTTPPLSTSLTVPLIIVNNPPVVTVTPLLQSGNEPYTATFTCSVAGGNMPFSYSFDFGNGVTNIVPSGNATSVIFNITYFQNGTYNVMCNVTDMDGDRGFAGATATVGDSAPFANFTAAPLTVYENDTVTFTDFSRWTSDPIVSWLWNFGDGTNSTVQNPTHRYVQEPLPLGTSGPYTVTLTVTDSDGTTNSFSRTVTVLDTVPQAWITAPITAVEGTNVTFVGFGLAYDSPSLTYSWNFGDGFTGTGNVVDHMYFQQANRTVSLTVTDNDNSSTTVTQNIMITDTVPTANAGIDQTVSECTTVNFNGSLSTGYDWPLTYSWNFGDGGPLGGGITTTHAYLQQGAYTVNLTVTDTDASTASDIAIVSVLDTAPNAYFTYVPFPTPNEGDVISFDATASAFNMCDVGAGFNFTWDFGDGNITSGIGLAATTHQYANQGAYIVNLTITDSDGSKDSYPVVIVVSDVNPNITSLSYLPIPNYEANTTSFSVTATGIPQDPITLYSWNFGDGSPIQIGAALTNPTHTYADNGTYTASVTVTDEDSSSFQSIIVNVNNVAPIVEAYGPYYCTANQTNFGLFSTATDPAGANDPITYAWDYDYTGAFDVNSTLQFPVITCPNTVGIYTLAVRANDGDGGIGNDTAVLNVTLVAINNPPYFVPSLASQFAALGILMVYDIDATDSDGNSINYTVTNISAVNGTYSIGLSNGVFAFTPGANGNYTFNVTICDDSGFANACNSGQFIVYATSGNVPPTASFTAIPNPQNEGSNVAFNAALSSDSDGFINFYIWNFGDNTTGAGVATNHAYTDNGVYTVNLTVIDNGGLSASTTLNVTITNVAPVPTIIGGPFSGNEGTTILLSGSATDAGLNDTLTYRWDMNNDGVYDAIGQSATFNATNDIGSPFTVRLNVTDDDGASATTTTTINVTNVAPTALCGSSYNGTEMIPVSFIGSATDLGVFDTLTYQWDFNYNGSFNVDFTGLNPNTSYAYADDFTGLAALRVTDNSGAQSPICTANVLINNANPVISAVNSIPSPAIVNEGSTAIIIVAATDPAGANDPLVYDFDCDGNLIYEVLGISSNNYNCPFADNPGNTVNVRVRDDNGGSATGSIPVTVLNVAPTAYAGGPYTCTQGTPINLAGSATDVPADVLSFAWDLNNDGIYDQFVQNTPYSCTDAIGLHTVVLRVTDDDLGQGTNSTTVNITSAFVNSAPIFNPALVNQNAVVGTLFTYDINALDANPGQVLNYTDNSALFVIDLNTGLINFTPIAAQIGFYNITITTCDNSTFANACTSGSFNLNISAVALAQCSDGVNNDGDAYIDANDAGCYNGLGVYDPNDNSEVNAGATQCSDGLDNDADTFIDWPADSGCPNVLDNSEAVVGNNPPTANAGIDQSVLINTLVTLNGAGSTDDGQLAPLTYSWTQISGPSVVPPMIGAAPTFTPTTSGAYTFNLTVYDGQYYSSDSVIVNAYTTSQAITTTGLLFYNTSFNLISTIPANNNMYVALTINNIQSSVLINVPSILTAAGFTILNSADGNNDNTILSNIPGVPSVPNAVTIWWYVNATGPSTTIQVNTAGVVDSRAIIVT